jgi:heme/copper-type cytochrome/quinol oxidase subunit 2
MAQTAQPNPSRHRWQWLIFVLLIVLVLIFPIPTGAANPTERVFRIDASRFEYDPAVIKVNRGDRVTIELVAKDVVHGLSVDGYHIETTANPGETARISFVADKQGTYRFRCTSTCGNLHPFMIGKLEVGQNTLLWRAIALMGLALIAGIWKGWK